MGCGVPKEWKFKSTDPRKVVYEKWEIQEIKLDTFFFILSKYFFSTVFFVSRFAGNPH